ncbi:ferric iron reductase protein FhuF [Rhizobium sp. PP-F2F-G38]|nr:ferric iron reductase protein FhuF [Rhizobium sp. PP-WC-1G-195]PYE94046.1 ferric iron reductase protein FhuF [Rhizobium sp. PP-F2F-G38]
MIAELAHLFKGPFAALGEAFFVNPAPQLPLKTFFASQALRDTLDCFSQRWPEPDPRAVATQWSKTYFSALLPGTLLPSLLLDWQLPLSVETVGLHLSPNGAVRGFDLSSSGGLRRPTGETSGRFDFLVEGHLRPVIDAMASVLPLSRKVLWSNAGNVFENVLCRAADLLGKDHPALCEANAILANRLLPDGKANPLFEPVRYIVEAEAAVRQRRICCLRYFTPELGYCKSCPKLNLSKDNETR